MVVKECLATMVFNGSCLGIAPSNFGRVFLYEFDNIEYRAGVIIGDPEDGNFEVEECESCKFHELADSFFDFIAGLVDDETVQYVPQISSADMRDYFGDAKGFSATRRLIHYSSAAKELAEAKEAVNFSYLARLKEQKNVLGIIKKASRREILNCGGNCVNLRNMHLCLVT